MNAFASGGIVNLDAMRERGETVLPHNHPLALKLRQAAQKPDEDVVINPKELTGAKKPATWSVMPRWITLLVGRIMTVGAAKYGPFNYRQSSIAASTYEDALERHLQLWFDGEDDDPETGESHLASVIAGCSLLLDAQATGKLADNRQKTGLARKTLDRLEHRLKHEPLPDLIAA